MAVVTDTDVLALARPLRPQTFGGAPADRIIQPVVEPLWQGIRVIAAVDSETATFLEDGEPVVGNEGLARALFWAIQRSADGAILDGVLTKQVVSDDAGVYDGYETDIPSTGRLIAQSMVGVRRDRAEEATKRLEEEQAARTFGEDELVNFVATDLLWIDGAWLLDVPLLERKRLLEATLAAERLVRPGTYVLPPIQTWVGSWRAQGFRGITYKSANSRYRPGERADDWSTAAMPRR